jgi:hypothetical protein
MRSFIAVLLFAAASVAHAEMVDEHATPAGRDGSGLASAVFRTYLSDALYVPPVPIPGAVWLLCSGLGGVAAFARRARALVPA